MKAVPLEAFKADRVRQIRDHTHFYWVDPMCMPITKLSMNDAETVVAHLDSNAPGWDEHFRQRDEINWRCFDHVIAPAIAQLLPHRIKKTAVIYSFDPSAVAPALAKDAARSAAFEAKRAAKASQVVARPPHLIGATPARTKSRAVWYLLAGILAIGLGVAVNIIMHGH